MEVREATLNDIDIIVDIHIKAFSGFFMTGLGAKFLRQYYKIYVENKHLAFVAESDDQVVGFIVGNIQPKAFYGDVKRKWFSFIIPLCVNILNYTVYTKIIKRILSVFFKKKINDKLPFYELYAELTSIGVNPDIESKGIGKSLIKKFENECINRKVNGIFLTTDAVDNDRVLQFYIKNEYRIDKSFKQDESREMYSLIKEFK